MGRPNLSAEKRAELLPVLARAFAERGYRRTTTGELARRCGVRENILYRLWPDKKAMFVAAIDYVYALSAGTWRQLASDGASANGAAARRRTHAERVLAHETRHHGEFGHYRAIFAGLSETDDPTVRTALARMYRRFAKLLEQEIRAHRSRNGAAGPDPRLSAWAIVGLGTVANIVRELKLLNERARARLIAQIGGFLLEGRAK